MNTRVRRICLHAGIILFFLLFLKIPAMADQVSYQYDDLGRLTHASHGDGFTLTRISYQYDPAGNFTTKEITAQVQDADEDQLPDGWEIQYGLDPNDPGDAGLDADGDGLTNLQELESGTDPTLSDTDGDGFSDGDEIALGTNPLDRNAYPPAEPVPAMGALGLAALCLAFAGLGIFMIRRFGNRAVMSLFLGLFLSAAAVHGHAETPGPVGMTCRENPSPSRRRVSITRT
nr:RHS repeat protein [Desulfobacula sp.]